MHVNDISPIATEPTADAPVSDTEPAARPASGFAELGLSERVLAAVHDAGYRHPTPIQREAIPVVLRAPRVSTRRPVHDRHARKRSPPRPLTSCLGFVQQAS